MRFYYCETEGYDLIVAHDEERKNTRFIDNAFSDFLNSELPDWLDIFDFDRPTRATIAFEYISHVKSVESWDSQDECPGLEDAPDEDFFELLLCDVKIIAEAEIEIEDF